MTARDLFLPVAAQPSFAWLIEWARSAEELGYDRVWMPETWGRDAVTILATMATETNEIGLGTSVANVYSRSPALLGQTAATLQEATGGRFRLGVGPSGPVLVEGWHGISYDHPLKRTRETIEIVRAVLDGEEVRYEGDVFELGGFRLRHDPPKIVPPIDAAGLGPKSVELAGRFADGWHGLFLSPAGVRDRLEDFRRGSDLGGRTRRQQRVTIGVMCCALGDSERARRLAREHLVFYIGAMGTFYREAMAAQGYETEANTIASRVGSGDTAGAIEEVSDDLLDTFAAAGSPAECRSTLEEFVAIDGVDAVSVGFPRGADRDEIESTIRACRP